MHQVVVHDGYCSPLTLNSRHLFSLMAPRQPRNPVTMTTVPRVMMRLAAESDGKEGDRVAKLPWDTDNHTPTPNSPHPPSWNTHRKLKHFLLICWLLFCWFHKCQHLKLCELCVCGTLPRRAGWRGRACTWRSRCNHEPWLNRRVLQEINKKKNVIKGVD